MSIGAILASPGFVIIEYATGGLIAGALLLYLLYALLRPERF